MTLLKRFAGKERKAAPISGILNTFFSGLLIQANTTVLNVSNQWNIQLYTILNRLTLSKNIIDTLQYIEGEIPDICHDPDVIDAFNLAFQERQNLYCIPDNGLTGSADAPIVPLRGRLFFELRAIQSLWLSDVSFKMTFDKSPDKCLITAETNEHKYRLRLVGFEVFVIRNIVNPALHHRILSRLNAGEPVRYQYQKFEFQTMSLTPGTTFFESPDLFQNGIVPPLLLIFCQEQSRHEGTYNESIQKFVFPGGKYV